MTGRCRENQESVAVVSMDVMGLEGFIYVSSRRNAFVQEIRAVIIFDSMSPLCQTLSLRSFVQYEERD